LGLGLGFGFEFGVKVRWKEKIQEITDTTSVLLFMRVYTKKRYG
jgi:hypothetical protein